eukprot:TRINITY_DN1231_c1_g1_i2.p1 TRINITY_DN1231_c1_g1~~TRINITY_DN1231_c1_g1_i2.p1  ORF type:complete len:226 (+),score=38.40 TRINITY_DN1231_c1_g1_i2:265-942(+)
MAIFTRSSLKAHERFLLKLAGNPTYPFQKLPNGKLVYTVRYLRLVFAILLLIGSATAFIIMIGFGLQYEQWFVYVTGIMVASGFATWTYRNQREYILDPQARTYTFRLKGSSDPLIESGLHNIYIRLRKQQASGKSYYYLVLNGYRVDRQILTDSTQNLEAMRAVGQQLASSIGINYFDEANISPHHSIIWLKPIEKPMSPQLQKSHGYTSMLRTESLAQLSKGS